MLRIHWVSERIIYELSMLSSVANMNDISSTLFICLPRQNEETETVIG